MGALGWKSLEEDRSEIRDEFQADEVEGNCLHSIRYRRFRLFPLLLGRQRLKLGNHPCSRDFHLPRMEFV
jgi:hypothetical protein